MVDCILILLTLTVGPYAYASSVWFGCSLWMFVNRYSSLEYICAVHCIYIHYTLHIINWCCCTVTSYCVPSLCLVVPFNLLNVLCLPLCACIWHMYLIYTIVTTSFVCICRHISVQWMHAAHLVAAIRGIPTETTNQNGVPQNLSCVAVLLHCARDYR